MKIKTLVFHINISDFFFFGEEKRPTGCLQRAVGWMSQQAVQMEDSVLYWEASGFPLQLCDAQRCHPVDCALLVTDRSTWKVFAFTRYICSYACAICE